MDDAARMLTLLRQRRAAMELDAMMAQLDIDTARARMKAAKAQIARIDQMIAQAAKAGDVAMATGASGDMDAGTNDSGSSRRRVGRPRRQPREYLLTALSLAPEQPAPMADTIRQQRLARQAMRRIKGDDGGVMATMMMARHGACRSRRQDQISQ